MNRPGQAMMAAMVLAAASCGPGGPSSLPPATGTTASGSGSTTSIGGGAEPSTPTPSEVGNAAATRGPFGRHDTPPGGVADLLDFGAGAGNFCEAFEPGPPSVRLAQIPLPAAVCAYDFLQGQTVDMLLRGPDGAERRSQRTVDEFGIAEWDLTDLPDAIQGEYLIRATLGQISVEATSRVASEALEGIFLPDAIRIGETGRMFLAGGPAGGSLPAYLYAAEDVGEGPDRTSRLRFAADLGPLQLDSNGEGRIGLTPQPGDPPGFYVVVVNPPPVGSPTPDPGLFVLPSGTGGEFVDLAESVGMTCTELVGLDCVGDIGRARVTATVSVEDSGALSWASASADGPSGEALEFYGEMTRLATGMSDAEDWIRSATRSDERRFGDALVSLDQHPNGSWHLVIHPFVGSATREVWGMFQVQP
jgi:predicted small lipoprotein YifL